MAKQTIYPYGQGGSLPSGYPIVDDLETDAADKALSAGMGKELNDRLIELEEGGTGGATAVFEGTKLVLKAGADLPMIRVSRGRINFPETEENDTRSATFVVKGKNLTNGITLTLTDTSGMFALSQNSISAANANGETTIMVTYAPTAIGNHSASIALSSGEATNTVELSGTAVEEIIPEININDNSSVTIAAETGNTATKSIAFGARNLQPNEQVALSIEGTNDITVSPATLTSDENGSIDATLTLTYTAGSADESGTLVASCTTIARSTIGVTGHVATRLAAGSYWIDGILKYTVLTDTTKVSVKKKDDTTEAPQYITFPASVSDEGMSVFDANGNQVTPSGMTYKLDNVAEAGFRHHASGIVRMVFEAGGVSYINKNGFNRNSYGNGHTDVVFNGYMGLGQYAFYKFNFGTLEMHGSLDQSSSFGSNSFDTLDFYENVSRINLSDFNLFTPTSGAKIIVRRDTMPTMSGTLPSALESVTLYVPADLVSAYQSHAEWGKITNILTIENDL